MSINISLINDTSANVNTPSYSDSIFFDLILNTQFIDSKENCLTFLRNFSKHFLFPRREVFIKIINELVSKREPNKINQNEESKYLIALIIKKYNSENLINALYDFVAEINNQNLSHNMISSEMSEFNSNNNKNLSKKQAINSINKAKNTLSSTSVEKRTLRFKVSNNFNNNSETNSHKVNFNTFNSSKDAKKNTVFNNSNISKSNTNSSLKISKNEKSLLNKKRKNQNQINHQEEKKSNKEIFNMIKFNFARKGSESERKVENKITNEIDEKSYEEKNEDEKNEDEKNEEEKNEEGKDSEEEKNKNKDENEERIANREERKKEEEEKENNNEDKEEKDEKEEKDTENNIAECISSDSEEEENEEEKIAQLINNHGRHQKRKNSNLSKSSKLLKQESKKNKKLKSSLSPQKTGKSESENEMEDQDFINKKIKSFGCHLVKSLNEENKIYVYKFKGKNEETNKLNFECNNKTCQGRGEYDYKKRTFIETVRHNVDSNFHKIANCFVKYVNILIKEENCTGYQLIKHEELIKDVKFISIE